jgi:hypothetical protein
MPIERREPPAALRRAAPDAEQLSAVDDALDHLLDPLEEVVPSRGAAPADEAAPTVAWPAAEPFEIDYGDGRASLRDLAARVRWSDRRRFRLARFVARWGVVAAVFSGVMWVVFSLGGPR